MSWSSISIFPPHTGGAFMRAWPCHRSDGQKQGQTTQTGRERPAWALEQSKIDDDVALRSAAADQHVAVGRRLHGLWLVADRAADEPGLASVADPGPACPPHGHIARLGKFEEALEGRGP